MNEGENRKWQGKEGMRWALSTDREDVEIEREVRKRRLKREGDRKEDGMDGWVLKDELMNNSFKESSRRKMKKVGDG